MLIKYSGKYIEIYFKLKKTFSEIYKAVVLSKLGMVIQISKEGSVEVVVS